MHLIRSLLIAVALLANYSLAAKPSNSETLTNRLDKLRSKLKAPHRSLGNKLPSFLKVCSRNDPNLNECVKRSMEHLRGYLAHGIPQLGKFHGVNFIHRNIIKYLLQLQILILLYKTPCGRTRIVSWSLGGPRLNATRTNG